MKSQSQDIKNLREDFLKGQLSKKDVFNEPHLFFDKWFNQAIDAEVNEPLAFNLATIDGNKPTSRIVYLREYNNNQFYFYSNYLSRKGNNIETNPHVCLNFFWPELERQIRIEGTVKIASTIKSDSYFNQRPTQSKIGAWSSPQSAIIKNREELELMILDNTKKFKNEEVPRPSFWGGYEITANYYEFWQGRKSRLHDRISFTLLNEVWKINRLAP